MKKFALAMIAASALVLGFGVVAQAQYGGGTDTVTASPTTAGPGGTVTVTASGCIPGENMTFTLAGSTVGTTVCTSGTPTTTASIIGLLMPSQAVNGTATVQFAAPTKAGTYNGTVTGDQGFSGTYVLTVAYQGGNVGPGGLPATGSGGIGTTTGIALGLFAVGLALLGVAQIRRRQNARLA